MFLHSIDDDMKERYAQENQSEMTLSSVCTNCYKELCKEISHGTFLTAEKKIKEDMKKTLWRNRLNLIRQARISISREDFAEAAASYEKYLKIIEYVYEKKREEISPQIFKDRPKEVTIVAAALWALVDMYDVHENFREKQLSCAKLLGEMIGYTNLYTNVVKTAAARIKTARNPQAYKTFLSVAGVKYSACFLATMAFRDRQHPTMQILCAFRDQILLNSYAGRIFVRYYYRFSPGLANHWQHHPRVRVAFQKLLPPIALVLKRIFALKTP